LWRKLLNEAGCFSDGFAQPENSVPFTSRFKAKVSVEWKASLGFSLLSELSKEKQLFDLPTDVDFTYLSLLIKALMLLLKLKNQNP